MRLACLLDTVTETGRGGDDPDLLEPAHNVIRRARSQRTTEQSATSGGTRSQQRQVQQLTRGDLASGEACPRRERDPVDELLKGPVRVSTPTSGTEAITTSPYLGVGDVHDQRSRVPATAAPPV